MTLFDEILDSLLTTDPGARSALRTSREVGEEVADLRAEVTQLQRTVAHLISIMEDEGVGGAAVRTRLRAIRGAPLELEHEDARVVSGSAYRGASPDGAADDEPGRRASSHCGACSKWLEKDAPQLHLAAHGTVCVACFQRGG